MSNFTTLNKFDAQGHPIKYDNYPTEEEAQARIIELHAMGLVDAFYIDSDANTHNGEHCIQGCTHWIADIVNKTISHNQVEADAEELIVNMENLRSDRDTKLTESDKAILPDQWANMTTEVQNEHSVYRQALRDLPATVIDAGNPVWPEKPK